jgi:hypothetical protein
LAKRLAFQLQIRTIGVTRTKSHNVNLGRVT